MRPAPAPSKCRSGAFAALDQTWNGIPIFWRNQSQSQPSNAVHELASCSTFTGTPRVLHTHGHPSDCVVARLVGSRRCRPFELFPNSKHYFPKLKGPWCCFRVLVQAIPKLGRSCLPTMTCAKFCAATWPPTANRSERPRTQQAMPWSLCPIRSRVRETPVRRTLFRQQRRRQPRIEQPKGRGDPEKHQLEW